tara:strand:- start:83 stop:445 length:363 start_codon:yes stop_codon:yes gene_type:complete
MKNFDEVLALASKTGDKVIVVSAEHKPFVLMSMKEYSSILQGYSTVNELSEEELLNKINRDIAIWKASQNEEDKPEEDKDYNLDDFKVENHKKKSIEKSSLIKKEDNQDEEDKYYIEPVE